MAALVCVGCTAVYSVGAPACPQCGSADSRGDWEEPRSTAAAAPTGQKTAPPAANASGDTVGAQKE